MWTKNFLAGGSTLCRSCNLQSYCSSWAVNCAFEVHFGPSWFDHELIGHTNDPRDVWRALGSQQVYQNQTLDCQLNCSLKKLTAVAPRYWSKSSVCPAKSWMRNAYRPADQKSVEELRSIGWQSICEQTAVHKDESYPPDTRVQKQYVQRCSSSKPVIKFVSCSPCNNDTAKTGLLTSCAGKYQRVQCLPGRRIGEIYHTHPNIYASTKQSTPLDTSTASFANGRRMWLLVIILLFLSIGTARRLLGLGSAHEAERKISARESEATDEKRCAARRKALNRDWIDKLSTETKVKANWFPKGWGFLLKQSL